MIKLIPLSPAKLEEIFPERKQTRSLANAPRPQTRVQGIPLVSTSDMALSVLHMLHLAEVNLALPAITPARGSVERGIRIYYEEHGQGAAILLIHGSGSDATFWSGAINNLVQFGRVITYDRRACGRTQRPDQYVTTSQDEDHCHRPRPNTRAPPAHGSRATVHRSSL